MAVGPNLKPNPKRKKSKLFSENRQYTSKTDDVHIRDGGEYIRKITQRTNTKISNFSEFPTPIQEKPVKLVQPQEEALSKYRSRTVKRKNKGISKFGGKITAKRNPNLKYYNIVTDLQKQKQRIIPKNLCWDFWNSEIVKSNIDPSEASHLAISKFGKTNTESIISEEDSCNNRNQIKKGQMHSKFNSSRLHNKNFKYPSGNAKTDATRTDSKSNKKTFSRENSLSSNRSNWFSKKPSIAANLNNRSISSRWVLLKIKTKIEWFLIIALKIFFH